MVSKRQGIIAIIVVIVLVAAGMAVVLGSNNKNTTNSGPKFVIDAMGRNVTTNFTPVRIVSASPAITELVYALGQGDKLVAVTDYCDYPSDVVARKNNHTLQTIGGFYTPNFEKLVNASPDLVLLDVSVQADKDMMAQLDIFHIKYVVMFECSNTTEVYHNIEVAGKVLNKTEAAQNMIASMKDRFAGIITSIGTPTVRPKVMVAVYFDESSLWIDGGQTFIDDIITSAGGTNAYADVPGFKNVARESAVQANPDYIIVAATMNQQSPQEVYDSVMNDTLIKGTNAVQNHHVYILINQAESSFLREGIREVQATQILAEMLYPSTFGLTLPHILSNEYLDYSTAAHVVMGSGSW
jgi:iron complex transport system substrate-binding protein